MSARRWVGVIVSVLLLVVVLAGLGIITANAARDARTRSCDAINGTRSALRGLLEQARTASQRNPLPPGLTPDQESYYQHQRDDAQQFYVDQLAKVQPVSC